MPIPRRSCPPAAVALGATLVLGSLAGERDVKAEDFFKGLFETDLRPGELIVAVKFPLPDASTSVAFAELARRHGDFALVGLAAVAALEHDRIEKARLVYLGCVDRAKVAQIGFAPRSPGCACRCTDTTAFDRRDLRTT